ncbi:hypothetical protein GWO43_07880 [candidate division KSB1 bacterium]|nr:hypothetical protein [candidate division KSB1 bacterium]NIS23888.1 hypothetical protein [candidate division KSB1 bacterium]NIT70805.1 hypothetical protein [candidate division KSB1 bacterium]NIU24537.1 hypothetical protein [candidate division KSB1 bacterium]NIU94491.1 hypothetical protein [candidate division KSB1 bacterium]
MKLSILQVPYDSGRFDQRMGSGPLLLTDLGLVNWLKTEGYDVQLTEVRLPDEFMSEVGASKYIHCQIKRIAEVNLREGYLPLILAGNCNYAAFGTLAALQNLKTGIIWLDAHGDFNTPETINVPIMLYGPFSKR